MPTSKKQLTKLNQAKKVKAEELSKQAAAGSDSAKKKLKKLEKKLKWAAGKQPCSIFKNFENRIFFWKIFRRSRLNFSPGSYPAHLSESGAEKKAYLK